MGGRRRGLRGGGPAAALLAGALVAAGLAVPAAAAPGPDWPTGRVPDCGADQTGPTFTDRTGTRLEGLTVEVNGRALPTSGTAVVAVGSTAAQVTVRATMVAPCSGARYAGVVAQLRAPGAPRDGVPTALTLASAAQDPFAGTWAWSAPFTSYTPSVLRMDYALSAPRFSAFTLDAAGDLASRTDDTGPYLVQADRPFTLAVVRAAYLTAAVPAGPVAAGTPVTVTGLLQQASGGQRVAAGGARVRLETREAGRTAFATVATGTTAADGSVALTWSPSGPATVRLVHDADIETGFTGPAASAASALAVTGTAAPARATAPPAAPTWTRPAWPAAGGLPTGCSRAATADGATFAFADDGVPELADLGFVASDGTLRTTVVVGAEPRTVPVEALVADRCSGVGGATVAGTTTVPGGTGRRTLALARVGADVLEARLRGTLAVSSRSPFVLVPDRTTTRARWSSFTVDAAGRVSATVPAAAGSPEGLAGRTLTVLRQSWLAVRTVTPLPAGAASGPVVVTGQLDYANGTRRGLGGQRVVLEVLRGSAWTPVASARSGATGAVRVAATAARGATLRLRFAGSTPLLVTDRASTTARVR